MRLRLWKTRWRQLEQELQQFACTGGNSVLRYQNTRRDSCNRVFLPTAFLEIPRFPSNAWFLFHSTSLVGIDSWWLSGGIVEWRTSSIGLWDDFGHPWFFGAGRFPWRNGIDVRFLDQLLMPITD